MFNAIQNKRFNQWPLPLEHSYRSESLYTTNLISDTLDVIYTTGNT
jgi:hypothetical protein